MNKPNKSILQCPCCEKPLVNIGSDVRRVHPVPRFIKKNYIYIVITANILGILLLVTVLSLTSFQLDGRRVVLGFLITLLMPSTVMYFLVRCYDIYRITDCPYCGHHEEMRLGKSTTP